MLEGQGFYILHVYRLQLPNLASGAVRARLELPFDSNLLKNVFNKRDQSSQILGPTAVVKPNPKLRPSGITLHSFLEV